MQTKTLTRLLLLSMLAASLAASAVLLGSMSPSERAKAQAPRVTIPALHSGEFTFLPDPTSQSYFPTELLMVRREDGVLQVWQVPTKLGRHTLPDFHWWKPEYLCKDFRPDFQAGEFRCNDTSANAWLRQNGRWTLDGKRLTPGFDNMIAVVGHESAGDFIFLPEGS